MTFFMFLKNATHMMCWKTHPKGGSCRQLVTKDYCAVSDFNDLVTDCHVVAAAMKHLGMVAVDRKQQ